MPPAPSRSTTSNGPIRVPAETFNPIPREFSSNLQDCATACHLSYRHTHGREVEMFAAAHMKKITFPARSRAAMVTAAFGVCLLAAAAPARADDPVLEWNNVAQQLAVVPALTPVQQIRAMAIVHVSVHDAVSAIAGGYAQYRSTGLAPAGATPE